MEEIKKREENLLKNYKVSQDVKYTSAHVKAGKLILDAMRTFRTR